MRNEGSHELRLVDWEDLSAQVSTDAEVTGGCISSRRFNHLKPPARQLPGRTPAWRLRYLPEEASYRGEDLLGRSLASHARSLREPLPTRGGVLVPPQLTCNVKRWVVGCSKVN